MKSFRIMLIIPCLIFAIQGNTQTEDKKKDKSKAEELYNKYGYGAALEVFDAADSTNAAPIRLLADSYRLTSDTYNAEHWYGQLVKNNNPKPLDILYYAQALQSNGKYSEAKHWFLEYSTAAGNNENVGQRLASICDIANSMEVDEDVIIKNMEGLNSEKLDFSPMFYKDGLVFTSTREHKGKIIKRKDLWTNDNFMDLYAAKVGLDDMTSEVMSLFKEINIKYHDGTATFTQDQNTMYFARSNSKNSGKRIKDEVGITRLKIHEAKSNRKGEWSSIKELPFNDDDFDTCHPTLSEDGNTLFFSSNRPGGFGGMDIYKSQKMGNSWSEPVNLGSEINTEGNEIFPFVHDDGTLYFASNGLPGIGGLDIFSAIEIKDENFNSTWSAPNNLGKPMNTQKDDFGLIVDISGTKGYFTSNRKGGKGMDDIYSFICKKGIQNIGKSIAESTLITTEVCVYDEDTGERLSGVNINIFSNDKNESLVMQNLDDEFLLELKPIDANKEKYTLNLVKRKNGNALSVDNQYVTDVEGVVVTSLSSKDKYQLELEKDGYEVANYEFIYNNYLKNNGKCIPMKKINCTRFEGLVINKNYDKPLPNAELTIMNKCTGEIEKMTANDKGEFTFCLECECDYEILATKKYFSADFKTISDFTCNQALAMELQLTNDLKGLASLNTNNLQPQPQVQQQAYAVNAYPPVVNYNVSPPTVNYNYPSNEYSVGSIIELKNIFYDFDKSYIREDAISELDKVVDLLKTYPSMRIELGSHTDARASKSYNQSLSQRRANSAVEYIASRGIARYRIVAMGYGENVLKNHCGDKVVCPEEAHQRNRRTEIKVLEFDDRKIDVRYIDNAPRIIDTPSGRKSSTY